MANDASCGALAAIDITRDRAWFAKARNFDLYVDGSPVGSLGSGHTKVLWLAPGQHAVFVKIDWCPSETIELELSPGGRAGLICGSKDLSNSFFKFFDAKVKIIIGLFLLITLLGPGMKGFQENLAYESMFVTAVCFVGMIYPLQKLMSRKPGRLLYLSQDSGREADVAGV